MRNYLLKSSEALPKSQGGVFAKKNTIRATLHPTLYTLSRATRYAATVLLLLCLGVGNAWGTETTTWTHGFEDATIWGSSNLSNKANNSTAKRTGSYGAYAICSAGSGRLYKGGSVDYEKDKTYTVMCWMKLSVAGKAGVGVAGAGGNDFDLSANTWTRVYKQFTATGNKSGANIQPTCSIAANCTIYVDDVVWYKGTYDVTAPTAASSASATTSSIGWTCGSDANTGIQNTLIWRRTSGSSDDLTLNAQGVYAASALDQSGHWTCVSATVGAAATSYAGTFSAGDRYAIVHRDLAYNYSSPTYVTVAAASATYKLKGDWDEWTEHEMTVSAGVASYSLSLAADTRYEFCFMENSTAYKNNGAILAPVTNWDFNTSDNNAHIHTGPAGTYTFSMNTSNHKVSVTYPTVTHPSDHYVYFKNTPVWETVYAYLGNSGNDNKAAAWPGCPTPTTTICNETYHYAALNAMSGTYNVIIFNNGNSGYGNQTSNLSTTGSAGNYNANADANWYDPSYEITFDANGGSGTMSKVVGICSGDDKTIPTNTFTRTGWEFTGWNTNKYGEGTAYEDGDEIEDITSNITLYAQWQKVLYMQATGDLSWWYNDNAWFAVWVANADESKQNWVAMTQANTCSDPKIYKATVPGNGYTKVAFVRKNPANMTLATWDNKWNHTSKESMPTSNNQFTITGGSDDNCTGTWGTYSAPTFTISYNKGTNGTGSRDSETKTCDVAFTLPSSAVFTRTGYTQTGWTTSDGSSQTHALGGSYTTNEDKTFYPVWTANNYDLTWNLGGGTTTSAGTGIASGVSSNTTSSVAYGTTVNAPTVTKTGYNFSAWDPTVVSPMPASDKAYTATWTAKTTSLTLNPNTANHGTGSNESVTATYAAVLPSFTKATPADGYQLEGYYTTATDDPTTGVKIINADGSLVASTTYTTADNKWNSELANLTLYARYELIPTYSITYNKDGATEDQLANGVKTEGVNFTLSSERYTKDGYWQTGWATEQGGSQVYAFGATYSTDANLTLYPAWTPKAEYEPDLTTSAKLSEVISDSRWTLTTGANVVSDPATVGGDAATYLTGSKYGLAFANSYSASATYDLGAQTKVYQITITMVGEKNNTSTVAQLLKSDGTFAVDEEHSELSIEWPGSGDDWQLKTFTFTFPEGQNNVQKIKIFGSSYHIGIRSIKVEYAPTQTLVKLDNQSATSAGTTSVTATWHASTNLTSSITKPTKTGYTFGGYYTGTSGSGTQLIDENGAWIASKTNYTDGSKNWQYPNADLTLYAKWTPLYSVTYNLDGGKYNGSSDAPTQAAVTSGTSITLPSLTPTKSGYVFASWKCSVGNTYHWESYSYTMTAANTTFTAQWVEAADLTSGTLYMVDDIKPLSVNAALSSTGQYAKGISSNGCFTSIGNPLRTDNSDGTFEFKTETKQTVDDIDFTKHMWFKGASNVTSNVPTSRGLKFSVASAGTLTVYCTRGDRINLSNGTTSAALTDNTSGKIIKREVEIAAAGTYYLYATDNSAGLAGIKFVEETCEDPELAYATDEVEKTVGDDAFTNTLTNTHGVTVSYESSDDAVATVNTSTGAVTIVAAGTCTITASADAQTVSTVDYCADDASYTLTVSNPTYTVTYNTNDKTSGSAPSDTNDYEEGDEVTVKGNTGSLARTGYVFCGWSTSYGGGTFYAPGDKFDMGSANVNLYPVWGQSLNWAMSYSASASAMPTPTKTTSDNTHLPQANMSNFSTSTNVSLEESSGKADASPKITDFATAVAAGDEGIYVTFNVASGYQFTPLRATVSTTATSAAKTIKVSVGSNSQTWAQSKSGSSSATAHEYVFASPSAVSGSGVKVNIQAYGDSKTQKFRLGTPITIYGIVEATGYTISFAGNGNTGGSTASVTSITSGSDVSQITANGFTKNGYSFAGWKTNTALTYVPYGESDEAGNRVSAAVNDIVPDKAKIKNVTSDITLTAQWTEITHTVTVSGGDHGTASTSSVSGVGIATASGNITATPASGYGFSSWTLPDGVTAAGGFSSSSNPIQINATADGKTITATYTATEYTITYTLHDGGAGSVSGNTTYTIEDDDYDLPTPTWSGHVFQGWYDNSSYTGDRIYVLEGGSTGNKTFHAKWGTEVPVAWTITKIDSKLYKGGGGYTVTAVVDNASWTGSASSLVLGASDGVVLGTATTSTNGDSKAQIVANFDITEDVEGDEITFTLTAPANGTYGAIEDEEEVDLDACPSGGGSTILFSQGFDSDGAGSVAYTANQSRAYTTESGLTGIVGSGSNLFTSISCNNGSGRGIGINNETGGNSKNYTGKFGMYASGGNMGYSLMRTADFAATAPTAIKIEFNALIAGIASQNKPIVFVAVGDGMTDGLTTSLPAYDKMYTGFGIFHNYNNSISYLDPCKFGVSSSGDRIFQGGASQGQITHNSNLKYTWVVNATGDDLEYTDPTGETTELATGKWDLWVGTTKVVSAYDRATGGSTFTGSTMQELYIGCNNTRGEFVLDDVVVTDLTPGAGSTGVATSLSWESGLETDGDWSTDHLAKEVGDADFTFTASADNTLGAITYSSSNTSVATVNATTGKVHIVGTGDATITATLAESGCYNGNTATYDITVTSSCSDVAGTVTTENLGCEGIRLTVSGYTAGATIAWYKDGDAITPAATGTTYTATAAGTYYAVTTGSCPMASNSVTIENADEDIDPIIFADEITVKQDRSAEYRLMQLGEGETITNVANTLGWTHLNDFSIDGPDENGIVSVRFMITNSDPVGDGTITLTITNGCSSSTTKTITIHAKAADAKPQIAWIATGTKGDISSVLADQSTNTALYEALEATGRFDLTPRNCYWTVSEADLIKEYSKYDLVILTDYPNSQTGPNGNGRSKSYTNALGLLIDRVPMLTFEAFVSGCPNWGFESNPKNTKSTQNSLTLLCNANDIFGTSDTYKAGADIKVGDDIASGQALQGFALDAMPNYVFIAKITDSDDNEYVTCCERQENMNARMMVFGLNANVMDNITEAGKNMVIGFVDYLLKDENASIPDCSVIFNGTTDTDWSTTTNWEGNSLPSPYASVRIDRPCVVADGDVAKAGYVKIHVSTVGSTYTGSLTISPQATMIVQNQIYRVVDNDYTDYLPTEAGNLVVQANSSYTGALIFNNNNGCTNATVEMYSPSYWETIAGKKTSYWSYVGVPIQVANVGEYFYGAVTYLYDETSGWIRKKIGSQFHDFEGIGLAMQSGHKETFAGTLASTQTKKITLTKTAGVGEGENMIGNSWTAPIQIANFDASDFGDATATVMIYQTGRDDNEGNPTYVTATAENDGSVSAGQWLAIPINVPSLDGYDGLKVIPAMQAFQVNTSSRTTLTLDYDKLVRGVETDLNTPMRAPARTATSAQREVESVMRVRVSGNTTRSDVWLLQAEQFSDAFDNGWEASYVECDNRSPQFYAQSPLGKMAFIAKQDLEGTVLGFAPSRDGDTYLITFHYVGDEEFYLNDIKLQQSVLIDEENSYTFTFEEGDSNRFYIGRTPFEAPSVTTGTVNLETETPQAIKVIYNDKLYIIRGGRVYSADGQLVK